MIKKLFTLFVVLISLTSFAQEPKLIFSSSLTVYQKNYKTDQMVLVRKVERYDSILYDNDTILISNNPDLKFTLYGEVTKAEDSEYNYYHRSGFNNKGEVMRTSTAYGKKSKTIKVMIYEKGVLAIYDIIIND